MNSPPFEFLGPYRIGEPLGRGGMGTVFSAVHEKTKQPVAVKLISDSVADESKFRRRFDAEIKSLQCLSHPGIVRIYGFGEEQGHLFYSMELVRGESLQKIVKREKQLEWQVTIDVGIQICAALKHAHDIGIIHRDLKPANLVVDEHWRIKLVDFGIAKIFGDSNTVVGSLLGTADYMAPEQATSKGITQRTDLYALGSVMYAMLAGRAPFTGKSVTQVINALQRDRPVPIDLIRPDVPDELVELIHELLEKSPEDRPPTALAVMNRLKAMKVGLERIQTVASDQGAISESSDDSLLDEDLLTDGKQPAVSVSQGRVRKETGYDAPATSDGKTNSSGSDDLVLVSPEEPTVMSVGNVGPTRLIESLDEDAEATSHKTHFQTVPDSRSNPGVFSDSDAGGDNRWILWCKVLGMISVLVFGVVLFLWAMRVPSADELYMDALTGNTGAIQAFLQLYPNDPRYTEVEDLQVSNKLQGVLNRLKTQSQFGITELSPSEESFMNVMLDRELEPTRAAGRIENWLNVYDSGGDVDDGQLDELIFLAKREQQRLLARAPLNAVDNRAVNLLNRIRQVLDSNDPERVRKELNGIVDTFEKIDWAAPAVREARSQLEKFENALQDGAATESEPSGNDVGQ